MTKPTLSVLMAYYDRAFQLEQTLASYVHHYGDALQEVELLIALDHATYDDAGSQRFSELMAALAAVGARERFARVVPSAFAGRRQQFRNPGVLYNALAREALADVLVLTNPENLHAEPVLTHILDHIRPNRYLVYGCRASEKRGMWWGDYLEDPFCLDSSFWYQHTRENNPLLHFCSAITAADWKRVSGFDPAYDAGLAFEDNDLVEAILANGMEIHAFDTPFVVHQWHSRDGQRTAEGDNPPEWWKNREHFTRKWGRLPRVFSGSVIREEIL